MKRYLVILAVILNGIVATYGQNLDVFHFMRTSPFRNFDTPSCETIYNGYVSLPGGQVHVGGNLGSIRYNNLFATDNEGYPTTLTATRFANSLSKNNYVGAISSMELLGFGFRVKKKFFITMDYRLRFNADIRYSKALFGLPVYGNMAYVDDPADMNISANVSAYQEIGISVRHKINDRMSWGVRPKVLFGMANLRADKVSALLTTDPVNYGLAMQYDALIKASAIMPYSLTFDKENGFSFDYSTKSSDIIDNLFKNPGVGIDLGFTFKPLPAFNVSFSVLDLGFINWKTNTTQMQSVLYDAGRFYEDGSLVFGGMTQDDIQYLIDGGKIGDYLDTLAYYFPLEVGPTKSYVTATPVRVVAQGDYEFAKHHTVSAAVQFRFASRYVQPSLTIAYDGSFFDIIDICVAYTMQRKSFDNLGFAIGLNLGYLNVYAGTQNIVSLLSFKDSSQLTATAGIVFNWGHFKNWREKYPKEKKKVEVNK